MRKTIYYLQLIGLLSLIWCILYGQWQIGIILVAPFVSAGVIFVIERFILQMNFYQSYYFNLFHLIRHGLNLLFQIYLSGIKTLPHLFTGKASPVMLKIPTKLREPFPKAVVSNSITLTPGTISFEVLEDGYRVLWLRPTTVDPDLAGETIKGTFEKPLLGERHD